jgi:glycosyltransferase involved in cell wall biosynthesis
MENKPLISMIMPTYKTVNLMGEALESVLAQTYRNWELIVVDDRSEDGTDELVQRYAERDPRIRYYCVNEHRGKPSIIRNFGLQFAQGSFITYMDADDVCYPNCLDLLITPLLEDTSLNASIAFPLVCDSELKPIETSPYLLEVQPHQYRLSSEMRFDWEKLCRSEVNFSLCCTMFRRQVIDQLGPLDEELITGEDYKYIVSLLLLGFEQVRFVPAYTFKYRTYRGSTTKTPEKILRHINCYLKVSDWFFDLPAMPEQYRQYKSEHLALMLSCLLSSLTNMDRKDLATIGLIRCLNLPAIQPRDKFRFLGKELIRIATPVWVQTMGRLLLNKQPTNYFSTLKETRGESLRGSLSHS